MKLGVAEYETSLELPFMKLYFISTSFQKFLKLKQCQLWDKLNLKDVFYVLKSHCNGNVW